MKLVKDKTIRHYELTYLISASATETEQQALQAGVAKLISKHGGEIVRTEVWGKRSLAYVIKMHGQSHTEAIYVHTVITLLPAKINALIADLHFSEKLIRHLLVLVDANAPEATTSEQIASATPVVEVPVMEERHHSRY